MATATIPLKQCANRALCDHPEQTDGWLPASIEYFYKNSNTKDGLFGKCKHCVRAEHKAWRDKNPEYFNEYDARRAEQHAADQRRRRRDNAEELRRRERERYTQRAEQQKQFQQQRRQTGQYKVTNRAYRSQPEVLNRYRIHASNRRARERNLPNTFTSSEWERCLSYFNHACVVCGRSNGSHHFIAADHWIPLTSPNCPGTIATNIVPLCHGDGGCNNSKGKKEPCQWLQGFCGDLKADEVTQRIHGYFEWVKAIDIT